MLSLKLYRFLLNFYPATFRENYAGPLEREFLDEYGEAPTRAGVLLLWARTLADFATSVPTMLAREFREDAWHAVRMWRKRPLPVIMAILALAIGIGANIGVFSVVDALLLRSLPFREPERLVGFEAYFPLGFDATPKTLAEFRAKSQYLEGVVACMVSEVNFTDSQHPIRVKLTAVNWEFFNVLGTRARAGRTFVAGEDEKGHDTVAVIGYALWQQMFGGDSRAIGSKISINGTSFEIIGVAPPDFDYPDKSQVWTPTVFDFARIPMNGGINFVRDLGRLKPGLTLAQAQSAMEAEAKATKQPRIWVDKTFHPRLVPLRDQLAGSLKNQSLILLGAVALLLLIACANVANLLLSRTADRRNEMAIRGALGASRARLIQQLLTESVVLSIVGAAASLVVAHWSVKAAGMFAQSGVSAAQTLTLGNWRIFAFAAGLALATGLLFGAAPALFAGSSMIRTSSQRAQASRLRSILVAVQIGLTVVLLAGGVSLGYAFRKLIATDDGFETRGVVSLRVAPTGGRYETPTGKAAYYNEAARRIRELAGVKAVSASMFLPLGTNSFMLFRYKIDGSTGDGEPAALFPVAPGFFSTLRIPMLAGREFDPADAARPKGDKPIIVSESYARKFVNDPHLIIGRRLVDSDGPTVVIGVVKEIRFGGPVFSMPEQAFPLSTNVTNFLIRVDGDPHERLAAIRQVVQAIDPAIPVHDAMTLDERFADVTARPRFYTLAAEMFGICALLLSIVGLYGMISYSVTQRTREMGIRMALGTTPAALRLMMMRQGLLLVILGAIPGVIATLFAAQWLEQLVSGATALTSAACIASLIPIAIVAALSVWIATNRISKLDPAVALRVE
ncbi:MAG TPA: ADOP family duplicated permease [Bryobacteraceae bacterium]